MTDLVEQIVKCHNQKFNNTISKENIKILNKYDEANFELAIGTRDNRIRVISKMVLSINKPFKMITKDDINSFLANMKSNWGEDYKKSTKEHIKIVIVLFFRWLYGVSRREESPSVVRELKLNPKAFRKIITPYDLWTDSEIKKLVSECSNSRDKAFIMTLYDSGARISELLSMNIEDVHFEGDICYINLPQSKTEPRKVGVLFATPYLQDWLDDYPNRLMHPMAPLWISKSPTTYGQRLKPNSTLEILTKAKRRAGIDKKINHHIMRHSRISICRKAGMPDALNRRRHGHSPGSKMIERYTWIDDMDALDGYTKSMGYEPKKQMRPDPTILKPQTCIRCGTENPATSHYCKNCSISLNYETLEKDLDLLEMLKSNFAQRHSNTLKELYSQYKSIKAEHSLLYRFQQCFNDTDVLPTEEIRQYFKGHLTDGQVLELLGLFMGYSIIDIIGDKVFLTDKQTLIELVEENKSMLQITSN